MKKWQWTILIILWVMTFLGLTYLMWDLWQVHQNLEEIRTHQSIFGQ